MEDCRTAKQVAEWNPQRKRRLGRPISTWKDGIRDSMQRRNLKYEDQELWRKKLCLWVEENCIGKKICVYVYAVYCVSSACADKRIYSLIGIRIRKFVTPNIVFSWTLI
jgi:hypothetical protein